MVEAQSALGPCGVSQVGHSFWPQENTSFALTGMFLRFREEQLKTMHELVALCNDRPNMAADCKRRIQWIEECTPTAPVYVGKPPN
jgi:hypothetical protein